VVPGGVRLRRAEPLREPDERESDRGPGQVEVPRGDVREAQRRKPAVDMPHDLDAVLVEVEQVHGCDPEQHHDERARDDRQPLLEHDHERER
jgi:hypothetical protein